ncbi:MAG: SRPBCC family protein [Bacteroidota bacterium]
MRVFKIIGLSLLALVVLVLVFGFMLPSAYHIERSKIIKAPASVVFKQVNTLRNWEKWSPWHRLDPNMEITYNNEHATGAGAWYAWKGNDKVKTGKLTIESSEPSKNIHTKMVFDQMDEAGAQFIFEPLADATKVTWTMDGEMGMNPIGRLFAKFAMDKMLGKDYEAGLHNLDSVSVVEAAKPQAPELTVNVVEVPEMQVISIKKTVKSSDIGAELGKAFGTLSKFMESKHAKFVGAPFAIYHSYDPKGNTEMEPAIPTASDLKGAGEIVSSKFPKRNAAVVDYYGDYSKSDIGHNAVNEWMKANKKEMAGSPWEEYITDPMTEPDTAKWLTRIYYPLK